MPSKYVKRSRKSASDRFMAKVSKRESGCWVWTGGFSSNGYGTFNLNGDIVKAHRASYLLYVGDITEVPGADSRGTCVLHSCDNAACVNPGHLRLGTHKDNMDDKAKRSRVVSKPLLGDAHQNSKLRSVDIPVIRLLRYVGAGYAQIGEVFGVTRATIHRVIDGTTWSHV